MSVLTLVIVAGLLAVLYGVVQTGSLLRASAGNAKMQEIAAAIQEGAQAYLAGNTPPSPSSASSSLSSSLSRSAGVTALGFLIGAVLSGVAGFAGMMISVRANVRTAQAASEALRRA